MKISLIFFTLLAILNTIDNIHGVSLGEKSLVDQELLNQHNNSELNNEESMKVLKNSNFFFSF